MRILLCFIVSLLFVIGCSNNQDDCSIENWLGTYIGTKACQGETKEDYEFTIVSIELPADPPPDNFLLIDDQLFRFQDCLLANGTLGGTEFRSLGSLEEGLLIIETDSCSWEATKQ